MKSEVNDLFLIQLKAHWCIILFTAEAIKHILHLKQKVKKNKQKKNYFKKVEDALKAAPLHTMTTTTSKIKKNQVWTFKDQEITQNIVLKGCRNNNH